MYHNEIVAEIMSRAASRGLLTHYCRSSRYCTGYPGLPDLIIVGRHGAVWLEVKRYDDKLQPDQRTWKHALLTAGQRHYVVREIDLADGIVDGLLDQLAGPDPDEYSH